MEWTVLTLVLVCLLPNAMRPALTLALWYAVLPVLAWLFISSGQDGPDSFVRLLWVIAGLCVLRCKGPRAARGAQR